MMRLTAAAAAAAWIAGAGNAALVLDQSYVADHSVMSQIGVASMDRLFQTIAVGQTGRLRQVSVQVQPGNVGEGLRIYGTAAGVPTKSLLGIGRYVGSDAFGFFYALDLDVTAGETLALAPFPADGTTAFWIGSAYGPSYPGGASFHSPDGASTYDRDRAVFGFRSYAEAGSVPEPDTWALMVVGFGAAGLILRRRAYRRRRTVEGCR